MFFSFLGADCASRALIVLKLVPRRLAGSFGSFLALLLGGEALALFVFGKYSFVCDFLVKFLQSSFQVSIHLNSCHVVLVHPFFHKIGLFHEINCCVQSAQQLSTYAA